MTDQNFNRSALLRNKMQNTWLPILTGPHAVTALSSIQAIADDLEKMDGLDEESSLYNGNIGITIFFVMLDFYMPTKNYRNHAIWHFNKSLEQLRTKYLPPEFMTGLFGTAWVVEWLSSSFLQEEGDLCSEIDQTLYKYLETTPWIYDYDLVKGLTGLGLYALSRKYRPMGPALVTRILNHLDQLAIEQTGGRTWFTPPNLLIGSQVAATPGGHYNLGMAHGVPGVIGFLSQALAAGFNNRGTTERLLDDAVGWLLAQRNPEALGSEGVFADMIPNGSARAKHGSRVGWCYGDLGISSSLYQAGVYRNRPEWTDEALSLARMVAARTFQQSGCEDAGLCHGAAGNALIFNRFFQATRDPTFREAAFAWYGSTLAFRGQAGLGGFQAFRGTNWGFPKPWVSLPGFLEGAAGIGLSLLAGVSAIEPSWDGILGVSLPPTL